MTSNIGKVYMVNKLSSQKVENLFIAVSCMELFMGLLRMCQVTLPFSRYVLWIFTVFYAAVAASRQYSKRQKALFLILMVFGILLYIKTGLNKGIRAVFYLYAMKDVDMRKSFMALLAVLVVSTLFFAVLSRLRLFGFYTIKDIRSDRGFHGIRYCFGYESPNTTMAVVFFALICELILYHEKQPWYAYGIVTGVYLLFFYLTDSRTGFMVGAAVIVGMLCIRFVNWRWWTELVFAVFIVSFVLMLVISVLAALHVENGLMSEINYFISGRMTQLITYPCDTKYALPYVENWHLFGDAGNHNDYDMGYIQIFYYYGIIPAACYLTCVVCAAVKGWKERAAWKLVLLLGLSSYLFMESLYFSNFVPVDFLLVYAVSLLWGDYGREAKDRVCGTV